MNKYTIDKITDSRDSGRIKYGVYEIYTTDGKKFDVNFDFARRVHSGDVLCMFGRDDKPVVSIANGYIQNHTELYKRCDLKRDLSLLDQALLNREMRRILKEINVKSTRNIADNFLRCQLGSRVYTL